MVRRTKEDAQATRASLLDAAERLFQTRGVSRTSLADIAKEAGATRGAIYWHFKDKADLFNAMMERVTLPLCQCLDSANLAATHDPAVSLRDAVIDAFSRIEQCEQLCRVLQIATHRVEFTEELAAVQEHRFNKQGQALCSIAEGLERAFALRSMRPSLPIATAALGLQTLFEGVLHQWLAAPGRFSLAATVRDVLDVYLAGLGLGGSIRSEA